MQLIPEPLPSDIVLQCSKCRSRITATPLIQDLDFERPIMGGPEGGLFVIRKFYEVELCSNCLRKLILEREAGEGRCKTSEQ